MSRLFPALSVLALLIAIGTTPVAAQSSTETPAATQPTAAPPSAEPPPAESPAPVPSSPDPSPPAATETPAATQPAAEPAPATEFARLTVEQFRDELVGVPLCGVPPSGPLAGKILCTVHLPDGIAVVAGSGILVRGLWEIEGGQVCRRSRDDPLERRRCVTYERLAEDRYKNSDGVEVCRGPCGQ